MQLHNAVGKLLNTEQPERHLTMPPRNERNAFTDERRDHGDDELVDRSLVQERRDDLASAHQPHVLAWLCTEAFGKGSDRLADKVNTGGNGRRRWLPRKNIVRSLAAE